MSEPEGGAYRPNVCAVLTDDGQERVLVFRRIDALGSDLAWQFPQGGLDPGESPEQGLARELREEIGTDRVEILRQLPAPIRYTYPPEVRELLAKKGSKMARFRGQDQIWFLARLAVGTDAIRFDTHTPEFDAFEWVEPGEAVSRVIPFKREAYREALRAFGLLDGGED
ncbi:MAG: RNA pyrophosphohydrolase [bacterium]